VRREIDDWLTRSEPVQLMAELTLIIIDLAAGHAKLIGTAPRALPILQLAATKLACHLAVSLHGSHGSPGFCHRRMAYSGRLPKWA
jgi:hypothetical protein